jgi:damage-control phosphatase, subfamily I
MQAFVDCIHCYLKQAVNCMTLAGVDEERKYRVTCELMDHIKTMDWKRTPAENSTEVLLKTYQLIKVSDPYREIKVRSNALALEMYPSLRKHLEYSRNRLLDALKISVAGNVIDLGINKSFDINASLKQSLNSGFSKNDYGIFEKRMAEAADVVIIGDNSGEIVFDRLLAEELSRMGKKVTYIVKGGPILNDVTMEDARQVGMDKTARIITTGSNYLGAILTRLSVEARSLLENADVVISKGQANYESLEHEKALAGGRIFFLLKIKCECVGKVAKAELGDLVFFTA